VSALALFSFATLPIPLMNVMPLLLLLLLPIAPSARWSGQYP
jgi:hypothetical protein